MHPCLNSALILAALIPLTSQAQHDPHRNATQEIAKGDFAKAGKLLSKAEKDDPETRFVRLIIASPVPWTANIKPGSKDPWDGFPEEREEIYSLISKHKIPGVFLISADRHRTDLRTTERPGSYTLYEFESSRLTNRHTHKVIQTPGLIWGYNEDCSFALMRFDTTKPDPTATFDCISIDGQTIHTHTLLHSKLK